MSRNVAALLAAGLLSVATLAACSNERIAPPSSSSPAAATRQVLLLSVDGLHAIDLALYAASHTSSALYALSQSGVTYTAALAPVPSDSFPGLLALVTGASPKTSGVYYDVSYDRSLYPPGSDCSGVPGTAVTYDESIDASQSAPDLLTTIDTAQLPRIKDSSKGTCMPLPPHGFLRVKTIFEIIRNAKFGASNTPGYTAWSDKHPAYDLVTGADGTAVDDLFVPEINTTLAADFTPGNRAGASTIPASTDLTKVYTATEAYDDYKVNAILNQIDGLKSDGSTPTGGNRVPTLFGMNFQAVSVAQKYQGYADASGTPSAGLADALAHTDASITRIVAELQAKNLLDSTLIIVTAKHGQSPIDVSKLRKITPAGPLANSPGGLLGAQAAQATEDDVSLLWLADQSQTDTAAGVLKSAVNGGIDIGVSAANIGNILYKNTLLLNGFGDPASDSRAPDIVVASDPGVIYTTSTSKIAEHGGFSTNDRNVALLVSIPGLSKAQYDGTVSTAQVAPTILTALGLDPANLDGAAKEHTAVLPELF